MMSMVHSDQESSSKGFCCSTFPLTGIQKNVQALYYILKHPLVYRDTKPRLDSLQKPYVPRKKVKSQSSGGSMVVSGSGSTHVFGWMLRT